MTNEELVEKLALAFDAAADEYANSQALPHYHETPTGIRAVLAELAKMGAGELPSTDDIMRAWWSHNGPRGRDSAAIEHGVYNMLCSRVAPILVAKDAELARLRSESWRRAAPGLLAETLAIAKPGIVEESDCHACPGRCSWTGDAESKRCENCLRRFSERTWDMRAFDDVRSKIGGRLDNLSTNKREAVCGALAAVCEWATGREGKLAFVGAGEPSA